MKKSVKTVKYPKYSFLMTVYAKESPEFFREAVDSMLAQTVRPDEIVIVEDGPLTDGLYSLIKDYRKNPIFKIVTLEENQGSGPASAAGVNACSFEWIARLDSDDIAVRDRIEKQFKKIESNPNIDIISTNVIEFLDQNGKRIEHLVELPETDAQIRKFAKKRCPFRTSSIMFKKRLILEAGNYRSFYRIEDYDAYVRMIMHSKEAYNIQENLALMRTDSDYYKRRGGLKVAISLVKFRNELLRIKFISPLDWIKTTPLVFGISIMPNSIRDLIYRKMLRKQNEQRTY